MSWAAAWGRFLPRSCLLCESACGADPLCAACTEFLPGTRRARCRTCARPWQVSTRCASCREAPPAFDATFAAADYVAPLDRAVTALKFSGRIGLASGLGGVLADRWRQPGLAELLRLDCLVPMPLAAARQAERGFNQAHLIARAMLVRLRGSGHGRPPPLRPDLLVRQRDTLPQSRLQLVARTPAAVFNVVLVHPEIPPNTGNVIRLCANSGCALHLIRPLGFPIDHARMRRAGLDYHEFTTLRVHEDWETFLAEMKPERRFALSTRGERRPSDCAFRPGDWLVFGSETAGLPPAGRSSASSRSNCCTRKPATPGCSGSRSSPTCRCARRG